VANLTAFVCEKRLAEVRKKVISTNQVLIDQLVAMLNAEKIRKKTRKGCNEGNKGIVDSKQELKDDDI